MKLQSALALFIWGSNHSYGNAFASSSQPHSISSKSPSTSSKSPIAFPPSIAFLPRGGAGALSSTVNEEETDVETTYPQKVAEYISKENWELLSTRGKQALSNLILGDDGIFAQEHVYKGWPEAGVQDDGKIQLVEQVSLRFW